MTKTNHDREDYKEFFYAIDHSFKASLLEKQKAFKSNLYCVIMTSRWKGPIGSIHDIKLYDKNGNEGLVRKHFRLDLKMKSRDGLSRQ